jgi:DNA-binding transcriptional ArsR family regulator
MQDLHAYFRALADRKRFAIVLHLAQHEQVTVTELGEALRMSQPLISWHLRRLRRAGIVKTRRAGRQVWCSLNRHALVKYQQKLEATVGLPPTTTEPGSARDIPLEPAAQR